MPGVGAIIAVASGKGGVGKSTVAANLALGLEANGLTVGVLDADIYGPSMPRMLGISGRPRSRDGKTLEPMENYGLKCMSMGFLVPEDTPMIWRGPMVMSALQQMLREVEWGELDIMVVDMPPGTGDAQLTMAQQVPLAGAVIVSTPQDIALLDARKGLNMFRKVDVPVLGIVENMSYFLCPHCGERSEIFSHGGARREAELLGVEFLGEVPLDLQIRETSDGGHPITVSDPQNPHAAVFRQIAARVWEKVSGESDRARRPASSSSRAARGQSGAPPDRPRPGSPVRREIFGNCASEARARRRNNRRYQWLASEFPWPPQTRILAALIGNYFRRTGNSPGRTGNGRRHRIRPIGALIPTRRDSPPPALNPS